MKVGPNMNAPLQNKYRDGTYYAETYLPSPMDLPTSTRWMQNYFRVVQRLFPTLDSYRKRSVLEIGSSFGGFVNLLNQRNFTNVTAADLTPLLFPKQLPNRFLTIDLLATAPLTDTFDLVFAFDVLEHINDSSAVAARIRQLLKPGGVFVFCVPYPYKKHLLDNYHTNMQYPPHYTNLFRSHGFDLLGMETSSFVPYVWRLGLPMDLRFAIPNKYFITEVFFAFRSPAEVNGE